MAEKLPFQSCDIIQLIENGAYEYFGNDITTSGLSYSNIDNKYTATSTTRFTFIGKKWFFGTTIPTNVGNTLYATIGVGPDGKTFCTVSVEERTWADVISECYSLNATTTTTTASIKVPLYHSGIALMREVNKEMTISGYMSTFRMHDATARQVVYVPNTNTYTIPGVRMTFDIGGTEYVSVNKYGSNLIGRHMLGVFNTRTRTFEATAVNKGGNEVYDDMARGLNRSGVNITIPLFMDGIPQFCDGQFTIPAQRKLTLANYNYNSALSIDFETSVNYRYSGSNYQSTSEHFGYWLYDTDHAKFVATPHRNLSTVQYSSTYNNFNKLDTNISRSWFGVAEKVMYKGQGRFVVNEKTGYNPCYYHSEALDNRGTGPIITVSATNSIETENNVRTKGVFLETDTMDMQISVKRSGKQVLAWLGV